MPMLPNDTTGYVINYNAWCTPLARVLFLIRGGGTEFPSLSLPLPPLPIPNTLSFRFLSRVYKRMARHKGHVTNGAA